MDFEALLAQYAARLSNIRQGFKLIQASLPAGISSGAQAAVDDALVAILGHAFAAPPPPVAPLVAAQDAQAAVTG